MFNRTRKIISRFRVRANARPGMTATLSLRRLGVFTDRRARADEVAVTIDVVDPPHRAPVFVGAGGSGGEAALAAAIGPLPRIVGDVVHRVRSVTQGRGLDLEAAVFNFGDFAPDRDHRITKTVKLGLG